MGSQGANISCYSLVCVCVCGVEDHACQYPSQKGGTHTHYLLGTHTCSKTSSTVMQLVPFGYSYGSATDVQKWASPVM